MSKYRSPFTQKCHQTTPFKKKGNWAAGYHTGEDWVADGDRTLVAPTSGTVSYVSGSGSYGNHLIIHTDDGNCILMAHMASLPCVKKGQRVKAGDKVGVEGSTGNSTGLHLHIEVEKGTDWNYNKNLLKPSDYIDFQNFGKVEENMAQFKYGDNNNGVFAVKIALLQLKREGIITQGMDANGAFGDGTIIAVKQVQAKAKLPQTGVVDTATLKAINTLLENAEKSDNNTVATLKSKIAKAQAALK